jgi:hypothetical protein
MKTVLRVLRGGTRNQSTADYQRRQVFIYGNRHSEAVFKNNTLGDITAESGILVVRDVATGEIVPAAENLSDLADVIGILNIDGEVVLATTETTNACYCISGDIDAGELILPGVATLDTTVGAKNLKDILTGLGFVLFNVTENAKFDN